MITADCDFPGGNILVDRIEGDTISVHQDVRDTEGDWFYWYLRVRGAAGREITVRFTGSDVIGVHGPAVSLDGGWTWRWLGADAVQDQTFAYHVPADADEVRFSFGMPYVQRNLEVFLARHAGNPHLEAGVLCTTRGGRAAEYLRVGKLDGEPEHRILLTARHHCCEMMASYAQEGILEFVLADSEIGAWFREHVEFLAIPFMDKDGVESGDQGKNRRPYDHNRDYNGDTPEGSIYATVRALRAFVPGWHGDRLRIALDMHCPWIRGEYNEDIYFPGKPDPEMWARTEHFGHLLQETIRGPLPYNPKNNLPFGVSWNTAENTGDKRSCSLWTATIPGIWLSATVEIPYANASGIAVTAESARAFGHDLARAFYVYLQERQ